MSNSLPVALLSPCSTWSDLKALLALPSYATILTALSSVYFITAGLQFWSTAFLITVLGESPGQAFIYIGAPRGGHVLGERPGCTYSTG